MVSLEPMTSIPMMAKLQTFSVKELSEKLSRILSDNQPPTNASMVIAHRSHGVATFPHPRRHEDPIGRESCMPHRDPHTVIFICGGAIPDEETGSTTPGDSEKAVQYVETISGQIRAAGLGLPRTYVSWTSNEEADANQLYGVQTTERLKTLKRRYDGANLFFSAYPCLG